MIDRWMRLNLRAFDFWTSVATAQVHAAITIAGRIPLLLDVSSPAARRRGERAARAMVFEKVEAVAKGSMRGISAALRAGPKLDTHPAALAEAATTIGRDAFEPARRTVRANARKATRT